MPVNLLITDASGMSVLTAWAAGKFSSTSVKKFFDEFDIAYKINSRTLIIPGKVAVMKGEIQDKLPEWNVVVGTREAVELVKYLRDGEHIKAARLPPLPRLPLRRRRTLPTPSTARFREDRCVHPGHRGRRHGRDLQAA